MCIYAVTDYFYSGFCSMLLKKSSTWANWTIQSATLRSTVCSVCRRYSYVIIALLL